MKSCCFTGHRQIEFSKNLKQALYKQIIELINNGVVDFYAGGAIGWDMLCSNVILDLRSKKYSHIKLHLILPCSEKYQTVKWNLKQKLMYKKILKRADSVERLADAYYDGCMKIRNQKLVDCCDCCLCYWNEKKYISGTAQTVRMANRKGIKVINFCSKENFKKQ